MARPRSISDEQILHTARECFLAHGPSVSTDVIAEQLGVSSPALFTRFRSKNELMMAALVPQGPAPWIPLVEAGPDARPLREQPAQNLPELAEFFGDPPRRMS